jgi:peptidyl-tRNA hydrolase
MNMNMKANTFIEKSFWGGIPPQKSSEKFQLNEMLVSSDEKLSRLYIVVRDDLPLSMTKGRAAAQASHATSVFHETFEKFISSGINQFLSSEYLKWKKETPQGFGTVYVKKASYAKIKEAIALSDQLACIAKEVIDPEYHLKDGSLIFKAYDVTTGMFAFGPDAKELTSDFSYL